MKDSTCCSRLLAALLLFLPGSSAEDSLGSFILSGIGVAATESVSTTSSSSTADVQKAVTLFSTTTLLLATNGTVPYTNSSNSVTTRSKTSASSFTSEASLTSQTYGIQTGSGTSFAISCLRALEAWSASSSEWDQTGGHNSTTTWTNTRTDTYNSVGPVSQIASRIVTLCDGHPRVVGFVSSSTGDVGTYTTTWPYTRTDSVAPSPYSSPRPCSIGPEDCTYLYSIWSISKSTTFTTASYTLYEQPPPCTTIPTFTSSYSVFTTSWSTNSAGLQCDQCLINADAARLLYWPVTTVPGSGNLCNQSAVTIPGTRTGDGPNTVITAGVTITSPSVAVSMRNLYRVDGCGPSLASTVIAVAPEDIFSARGHRALASPWQFDFADLNLECLNNSTDPNDCYTAVPATAYFGDVLYNPIVVSYEYFAGSTIWPSYQPQLLIPHTMSEDIARLWGTGCDIEPMGVWDPPIALTEAKSVVGPTAPTVPVTTSRIEQSVMQTKTATPGDSLPAQPSPTAEPVTLTTSQPTPTTSVASSKPPTQPTPSKPGSIPSNSNESMPVGSNSTNSETSEGKPTQTASSAATSSQISPIQAQSPSTKASSSISQAHNPTDFEEPGSASQTLDQDSIGTARSTEPSVSKAALSHTGTDFPAQSEPTTGTTSELETSGNNIASYIASVIGAVQPSTAALNVDVQSSNTVRESTAAPVQPSFGANIEGTYTLDGPVGTTSAEDNGITTMTFTTTMAPTTIAIYSTAGDPTVQASIADPTPLSSFDPTTASGFEGSLVPTASAKPNVWYVVDGISAAIVVVTSGSTTSTATVTASSARQTQITMGGQTHIIVSTHTDGVIPSVSATPNVWYVTDGTSVARVVLTAGSTLTTTTVTAILAQQTEVAVDGQIIAITLTYTLAAETVVPTPTNVWHVADGMSVARIVMTTRSSISTATITASSSGQSEVVLNGQSYAIASTLTASETSDAPTLDSLSSTETSASPMMLVFGTGSTASTVTIDNPQHSQTAIRVGSEMYTVSGQASDEVYVIANSQSTITLVMSGSAVTIRPNVTSINSNADPTSASGNHAESSQSNSAVISEVSHSAPPAAAPSSSTSGAGAGAGAGAAATVSDGRLQSLIWTLFACIAYII